jgi:hypothetical protein
LLLSTMRKSVCVLWLWLAIEIALVAIQKIF